MTSQNFFKPYLDTLWARLNDLDGLLFLLCCQLKDFRGMYRESLEKRGIGFDRVRGGTSLFIRDLSDCEGLSLSPCYPTGRFIVEGEAYLDLVDQFIGRESTWTASQCYEQFESFLKNIVALFFSTNPGYAPRKKLGTFSLKGFWPNEIESWRSFVEFAYRGGALEILKDLRRLSPILDQTERRNARALDLASWVATLAEVRHAVVHSGGIIRTRRTASWSASRLDLLKSAFGASPTNLGYSVRFGPNEAREILTTLAEYSYLVYKAISELSNCPVDIFNAAVSPNPYEAPGRQGVDAPQGSI